MATYYRWRKSTVKYQESSVVVAQPGESVIVGNSSSGTVYIYDVSQGPSQYLLSNPRVLHLNTSWNIDTKQYFDGSKDRTSTMDQVYMGTTGYDDYGASYYPSLVGNSITLKAGKYTTIRKYKFQASANAFQNHVYSTSSSAYPNGGVHGGYYYDQRTTVTSPTAPTGLTYPNPITTPSAAISWTAATSATDYPVSLYEVSYSTNGGSSWTVAGTTAEVSYTFSITPGTTSIMFRVRAKDSNGQWGDYVTGTASQVLLAPTLTVPQMVMQGQSATISWSAIEGADSYTLQRKSSADADWTQVYSGANLSYSETVGTWTSLQYRVQAVFDETPGGWAESAAIPVVSSSALVISGTDGDLGTVVNDIPYSISTDTGNQITATITVNSAVIFSGNVGNSTSDTIPVLDLVNGEGTIVIEASVTASGGPVSAVRTWTYTKSLITFPNAGSVAQLTKEGENIFPKTLAECVRLPGGKTLDQVTEFPAQVYAGSYVGTGTYGQSNPNSLTFPFEPKVVFVRGNGRSIIHMITGCTQAETVKSQGNDYVVTAWDGNSVSWYITDADRQLNMSGQTYYYAAIG